MIEQSTGQGWGEGEEEGRGERRVGVSTGSFYIGLGACCSFSWFSWGCALQCLPP